MEIKLIKNAWGKIITDFEEGFENSDFYDKFFKTIEVDRVFHNKIFFRCKNFIVKNICQNKLKSKIESKFLDFLNLNLECFFLLENEEDEAVEIIHESNDYLNKNLTFETYVVGDFNNEITQIKEKLLLGENDFSPVFIYAKTGFGKTHAINALGNSIKQKFPNKKILFLNTDDFSSSAYESISNQTVEKFKKSFYDLDVLIVDDIQFFARRKNINQIFFTIFNKLYSNSKIIILACDKKPDCLDIDARMISRFQSGLAISINKPDEASLKKIIYVYQNKYKFLLSDEASSFLINRFSDDIRILIGVIKKIALNFLNKETISKNDLEKILKDEINLGLLNNKYKINPEIVIQYVGVFYQLNYNEIISNSRKKETKFARSIAIYILREKLNLSYTEIGHIFSNRSHSTIINSYKMLKNEIEKNANIASIVEKIIKKI